MNMLGNLAALAQQQQQGGAGKSVPAQEPGVQRLPPAGRLSGDEPGPAGLVAEAEAETRRMWEEATREMARETATDVARETVRGELKPWEQRLLQTETKVIETDAAVVKRLSRMEEALESMDMKALDAERFERRINVLIALVAAVFAAVMFLALR
jgi:hypothetical protein